MPTDDYEYLQGMISLKFPACHEDSVTTAPTGADTTERVTASSYHLSCDCQGNTDFLKPQPQKLPRKLKKAAKTLYFAISRASTTIRVNPTPKTRWQRRIKRKCPDGAIMTPGGQILKFAFNAD